MHGKLRAMVSEVVCFMLLYVPLCVHVFVCARHVRGTVLKGANILFLISEVSGFGWLCDF